MGKNKMKIELKTKIEPFTIGRGIMGINDEGNLEMYLKGNDILYQWLRKDLGYLDKGFYEEHSLRGKNGNEIPTFEKVCEKISENIEFISKPLEASLTDISKPELCKYNGLIWKYGDSGEYEKKLDEYFKGKESKVDDVEYMEKAYPFDVSHRGILKETGLKNHLGGFFYYATFNKTDGKLVFHTYGTSEGLGKTPELEYITDEVVKGTDYNTLNQIMEKSTPCKLNELEKIVAEKLNK